MVFCDWNGAVERIRTFDRLVNSQPLYRAEPRRHIIMLTAPFQFYYLKLSLVSPKKAVGKILREFDKVVWFLFKLVGRCCPLNVMDWIVFSSICTTFCGSVTYSKFGAIPC